MLSKEFKSLFDLSQEFPDEQSCIDFLEKQRWNGLPLSPFDNESKVWKCRNNKYRCKNTRKYFSVTTGTLFENTKISLRKWFTAIWLMTSHKKGISSIQLGKDIGVTQKTAWFLAQRIRACFCLPEETILEGVVEVDETFVGGKNKNRHKDKKVPMCQGRSFKDKTPVLGILQRGGPLMCFVIPDTKTASIQPILKRIVKPLSTLISDEWMAYNGLNSIYNHYIVNHAKKEYVNQYDSSIHSNSIEGFWGIFKRGINGIYNWVSRKHLQFYANEFVFRFNNRKIKESERFSLFLCNINHRLKYKHLIYIS